MADSCAAVGVDVIINNRLGDVSYPLLVAEVKKDTGNIDTDTDHGAHIERIQLLMNPFLVEVCESDFISFSP